MYSPGFKLDEKNRKKHGFFFFSTFSKYKYTLDNVTELLKHCFYHFFFLLRYFPNLISSIYIASWKWLPQFRGLVNLCLLRATLRTFTMYQLYGNHCLFYYQQSQGCLNVISATVFLKTCLTWMITLDNTM